MALRHFVSVTDGVVDELDLELMNACMGAMNDPNIVRFDLDYGSRVDMPDFAWFSYDYGYSADPNESGNNDPNCARSDFDGDERVDIADLALLAEHWLRPVFDEYRICRLCNLHTAIDPNDPNAPSGSTMIDLRDYDALMADWGMQSSFDPNIVIEQSASMLSVAIENPVPAWKISAFLDNDLIGQWETGGLGSTAFDVDLTRYGPGSHRVKVVRNIGYGMEITEQVITDPNSTGLYCAAIPDAYEPNEPYYVGGFNLGDELNIKIKDIYEQPVYEVNIPSGVVALEISSEVFDEALMATFSVSRNTTPTPEDEERYEKLLKRKFDPDSISEKYVRVLLLLPDAKVIKTYKDAIFSVMKASEKRGVRGVVLTGYDVNKDNLDVLFKGTYGRKIVVYFGHANSHVENVQRTRFQCYALSRVYDPDNYYDVGAVSYTKYTNNNAVSLPFYTVGNVTRPLDDFAYDMSSIFQRGEAFVDQMYVFGCLSAACPDMAIAQGCGQEHDQSVHDMLYVGFTKSITQNSYDWIPGFKDLCTLVVQGLTVFFDELGDGKTIQQAIAKVEQQETGIRTALFGTNGRLDNTWGATDRTSEDDDRLTVYGLGYVGGVKFSHYGDNQ